MRREPNDKEMVGITLGLDPTQIKTMWVDDNEVIIELEDGAQRKYEKTSTKGLAAVSWLSLSENYQPEKGPLKWLRKWTRKD